MLACTQTQPPVKMHREAQVDDSGLVKGLELDDHEVRRACFIKGFALARPCIGASVTSAAASTVAEACTGAPAPAVSYMLQSLVCDGR